jgi:hypothetical protein
MGSRRFEQRAHRIKSIPLVQEGLKNYGERRYRLAPIASTVVQQNDAAWQGCRQHAPDNG